MTALLRLLFPERRALRMSPMGGIVGYANGRPVAYFNADVELAAAWRAGEL